MSKEFFIALAFLAGVAITFQSGINAELNTLTKNPIVATLISFLAGMLILILIIGVTNPAGFKQIPVPTGTNWWKFIGGFLGALYVCTVIVTFPKLGAATTLSLIIAGQLISAVIFDHYGFLGFAVKTINIYRIIGIAMIIGGVLLVRKF
ncbi:MAG: family transporter [Chitinophagaceae bacterium]|nr:family transporter [Chitinophagaceae bacterium]